jgi:hypothetical protein
MQQFPVSNIIAAYAGSGMFGGGSGSTNRKYGSIRARFHMKDDCGSQSIPQKYFEVRVKESTSGVRVYESISANASSGNRSKWHGVLFCVFSCGTAGAALVGSRLGLFHRGGIVVEVKFQVLFIVDNGPRFEGRI